MGNDMQQDPGQKETRRPIFAIDKNINKWQENLNKSTEEIVIK